VKRPARQDMKYSEGLNWVRVQVAAASPSVLVLSQIQYPVGVPMLMVRLRLYCVLTRRLMGTVVTSGAH
jgi:hypothetical protein